MAPRKILLTGASGYMYELDLNFQQYANRTSGGAVLAEILQSNVSDITISAFVRSAKHRDAVRLLGVTPVHFDGLHDLDTIRTEASKHDG
jgi:hypothetical protein